MVATDVAIIGFSFRMPQDAENEDTLWEILEKRRNLMTSWPESRLNLDAFHDDNPEHTHKLHSRGAHFLSEEHGAFDAPFFSIGSKEAAAMDPQQRLALETSYRAFENAGLTLGSLRGSRTGVFSASMTDDYSRMLAKDPDSAPVTALTGNTPSILPNRLSWYYDLSGPSVHVDTACSSSLTALDLACQYIRSGDISAALITSSNLILGPEGSLLLSNLNFLSPDSLCYSFDHRANGYARGEGVVALVLKPLAYAARDGDCIRGIIRSSGLNQDGRTPTMTQPGLLAQEALIRRVYEKENLDLSLTRYVEAHGTGTPVGDPIEMEAIGRVFGSSRTTQEPLYVGSIKANVGHLEATSGLAGLIKAILILERGIIPPNALYEKSNPDIDHEKYHTEVPTKCVPWPTCGLRRVSVNSFGFGGANVHVVLDDVYHRLLELGLVANHCTRPDVPQLDKAPCQVESASHTMEDATEVEAIYAVDEAHDTEVTGTGSDLTMTHSAVSSGPSITASKESGNDEAASPYSSTDSKTPQSPYLLVLTAADEKALGRVVERYSSCMQTLPDTEESLRRLEYTLAVRKTHMPWRTFAVTDPAKHNLGIASSYILAKPARASASPSAAFVFTGQGAQYAGMGLELLRYAVYREAVSQIDAIYRVLGCEWSVIDELSQLSNIHRPEYSQPLCTAVQIALVDLLRSIGLNPKAVIGHSSGEIAAAYCVGAISKESACKVAYFRGQLAGKLKAKLVDSPGAMMSVNIPEEGFLEYLEQAGMEAVEGSIHIACINSPFNITLSGEEEAIDELKLQLDEDAIYSQKLNTGVPYHSPAMKEVASDYNERLEDLQGGDPTYSEVLMISSVTGKPVSSSELTQAQYWVDNSISPVRFLTAVRMLVSKDSGIGDSITDIVEIGPHSALRRPIRDTIQVSSQSIRYDSALDKSKSSHQAILGLVGRLFTLGHQIKLQAVIGVGDSPTPALLPNCPEYPFDHSRRYWDEPRMSRDYRLRDTAPSDMLGSPCHDWNPKEPRWRKFISIESTPWTGDHIVTGSTLYPAAGMLVMTMEGVKQLCPPNRVLSRYHFKEAHFLNPLVVGQTVQQQTEIVLHLRPLQRQHDKEFSWADAKIYAFVDDRWEECFQASVQLLYENLATQVDNGQELRFQQKKALDDYNKASSQCSAKTDSDSFYQFNSEHGLEYGYTFRGLEDIRWDGDAVAVAYASTLKPDHGMKSVVHPAMVDMAFQLGIVPMSRGLSGAMPTMIPQSMFDAWFSATGWQDPQTSTIRYLTRATAVLGGRKVESESSLLGDDDLPLCFISKLVMSTIASKEVEEGRRPDLLYQIQWKPQLSMMRPKQLQEACQADCCPEEDTFMLDYRQRLEALIDEVLVRTYREIELDVENRVPKALYKYVAWMKHYIGKTDNKRTIMPLDKLEEWMSELEVANPRWRMYVAVARALPAILNGEQDPLQLLFDTDLAEMIYADLFGRVCDRRFQTFIDLTAHEKPVQRILELGAGTGGFTGHILSALSKVEEDNGGTAFSEYMFTDISPSFFENAQERFGDLDGRMKFKTLDLERPASGQGLELARYDLIFAGSVLHATTNLNATMRNVRSLLKPGGKLVIFEVIDPNNITINFGFGIMPGWWVASEEWRVWSPNVSEQGWGELLQENGFSGNDLILRDSGTARGHIGSIMVSTAQIPEIPKSNLRLVVIVDDSSKAQTNLAALLREKVQQDDSDLDAVAVDIMAFHQLTESSLLSNDRVIALLEVDRPFLASMLEDQYQLLKVFMRTVRSLVWVSATAPEDIDNPDYSMAKGFLRSMRSEAADKSLIGLTLEGLRQEPDRSVNFILQIFSVLLEENVHDVEYVVRDGQILTWRTAKEQLLEQQMRSHVSLQDDKGPWLPGRPLVLGIRSPGMLDTLEFSEDLEHSDPLEPEEVEIESKAWGLSFRDVFAALGRLDETDFGYDGAGVVTRVGSGAQSRFKAGDRVYVSRMGCMRTYPRAHADAIVAIPDHLSFEAAASLLTPAVTAYHSVVQVARLRRGEKILIHSAAGSTGQLSIWMAKMIGAEIFATVGMNDKRDLLIKEFDIPADHIFYSRDVTFASGITRMTNGRGVDVVINSLFGDGLRASWECLAPYGRFIELGKADIIANSSLPMASFSKNRSFMAVDIRHIALTDQTQARELMQKVVALLTEGVIQCPKPLHLYSVSDVEGAFRYLQSGKNTGRIVITVDRSDIVPKRLLQRGDWSFREDASYLVCGGLGGVGRAVLSWMATKGVKHLIVPSRSGATSKAAIETISELAAKGVNIWAPACDASSSSSLRNMLDDVKGKMPPVRGCINSAMVLQDAVFENMSYAQWSLTVRSKARTAWNLHQQLPDLDFYILFSSLGGLYGNIAQSNYAAGCAFQDALAKYRTSRGQTAVSFDIGWMRTVGIIAENELYQRTRRHAADMGKIETEELLALLDIYCDPMKELAPANSQLLIGAVTAADLEALGHPSNPVADAVVFSRFAYLKDGAAASAGASDVSCPAELFRQAADMAQRARVVVEALSDKLARALMIRLEDVEPSNVLSDYGVDSLMAVELRNWIRRDFGANVTVFDIMGGASIKVVGNIVAERSEAKIKEA